MGNCLRSSSKVEKSSNPSKVTTITAIPLLASTSTNTARSTPSNLTVLFSERRGGNESLPTPRSESEILLSSNMKVFTFKELRNATRNFNPGTLLGEGGFAMVFKGWIDEHTFAPSRPGTGMLVAVKKFTSELGQGHRHGHKEWLTEINYLGQLHHPNIVKLIGYCSEDDNRLLVYEFMQRRSLDNHLYREGAHKLSWDLRLKIAIGAAKGISYLHDAESQVIYGDIKTSNILLDSDYNCKLSDFGLAKAIPAGDNTTEVLAIAGTYGYVAPEYMESGRLSAAADIYSFGVVLLELVSGRRVQMTEKPYIEINLLDWAKHLADKGKLLQIMDNKLGVQYPKKGAHMMVTLALQCTSVEPTLRPRISKVLETLEQISVLKNSPQNFPGAHPRTERRSNARGR